MGWKTLKERFNIRHIVQVAEKGVCIGSGYVHDLAVVDPVTGKVSENRTFKNFIKENCPDLAAASAEEILSALAAEDSFTASIPVFTYDEATIIEKQCEELGWPNVTHDGCVMYENTFFSERAKAVEKAKVNLRCWRENVEQRIKDTKADLARMEAELDRVKDEQEKIEKEIS